MLNRKTISLFLILMLVASFALVACGGTQGVEQAVEEAAQDVEQAAETVDEDKAEVVEEVATAVPEVEATVEEVTEAVEEEATAVVEEVAEEVAVNGWRVRVGEDEGFRWGLLGVPPGQDCSEPDRLGR